MKAIPAAKGVKTVKKIWSPIERRAEIIKILEGRRKETMANLAFHFGVSIRTINYDIEMLTADHPIVTLRGVGGCVMLMENYHTYRNDVTEEQQNVLITIIPTLDKPYAKVLGEMLLTHGSTRNRSMIEEIFESTRTQ